MSLIQAEAHGYTLFHKPATLLRKGCALGVDFSLVCGVSSWISHQMQLAPFVELNFYFIFCFCAGFYWIPQQLLFKKTIGDSVWKLQKTIAKSGQSRTYTQNLADSFSILQSLCYTSLSIVICILTLRSWIMKTPSWMPSPLWELPTFLTPQKDWIRAPFFYALGNWPQYFNGHLIFYTLPYEKGPPQRFIGRIIAHLGSPLDAALNEDLFTLTLEGPKTPKTSSDMIHLQNCFLQPSPSYSCLMLKNTLLKRHIQEMRQLKMKTVEVKWFRVSQPSSRALQEKEYTQGIYLRSKNHQWTQDRFILVYPQGIHQALILHRPNSEIGDLAFQLIQRMVGSLQNNPTLEDGKMWIQDQLTHTQLNSLKLLKDQPERLDHLEEIQILLLSYLSIDPSQLQTYFHLSGTALMLIQNSAHTTELKKSWILENLKSAYLFSKDLTPSHEKLTEIRNHWSEAKKSIKFEGGTLE